MSETKTVLNRYVLGFMFDEDERHVLLVWKNRPAWQAGKLNGIGGKIEAGETPLQAMEREFTEETYFVSKKTHETTLKPVWTYVGMRFRPLYQGLQETYEMFVFACKFDTKACVFDDFVFGSAETQESEWDVPVSDPNREEIINIPLNREILNTRGVPGLSWTTDISLRALHEGFTFEVRDPLST